MIVDQQLGKCGIMAAALAPHDHAVLSAPNGASVRFQRVGGVVDAPKNVGNRALAHEARVCVLTRGARVLVENHALLADQ